MKVVIARVALGFVMAAALGSGRVDRSAPIPTPNYVAKLQDKAAWAGFPLRVFFVRDSEYSAERETLALSGFRQWSAATDGIVRFEVTEWAGRADITVTFDPDTNDGATTNSFSRGEMIKAEMRIGVKRGKGTDITCIAAHEFGHALGLSGHSEDRKDLMYAYHWMGKGCGITSRDVNTLASRYPAIALNLSNR